MSRKKFGKGFLDTFKRSALKKQQERSVKNKTETECSKEVLKFLAELRRAWHAGELGGITFNALHQECKEQLGYHLGVDALRSYFKREPRNESKNSSRPNRVDATPKSREGSRKRAK